MGEHQTVEYSKIVEQFAALGSRIIKIDRTTHYKHIGAITKRPMEPGFIPIERPARVVTVSYYPNETELETTTFKAARDSFDKWAAEGTLISYEAAYKDWLASLPNFPFHRDFDRPVFDALNITDSEFAWLPLLKAPLPARTSIPDDDIFIDRMLLWEQLWLLKPTVILAQGMIAADIVKPMCEDKFPHTIVVQKISRYGTTALHNAEDSRVIAELSKALQK